MATLFGFEFKRKQQEDIIPSFTPREVDDGAAVVTAGGYGTAIDIDGTIRTEAELVTKYREMSLQPECDAAIDEIVNESISCEDETIVDINLDNVKLSNNIKKVMREEFQTCLNLLDFNRHAYEIYRKWYIDGRLYYYTMVDEKNPKEGIKEVRYIDPRKIRKIREVSKKRLPGTNGNAGDAVIVKTINEYFMFNDKGFNIGNRSMSTNTNGLRIAKDSIVHVVSGSTDTNNTMVLSFLHKGIKALNQLRTLEDALIIYRLVRAPERRVWYIDVGNLPKVKAEQYMRDTMVNHKNRLVYDSDTGNVKDSRKFLAMLDDYFLPRREGGRGTEVTTLGGGQNLGQMDDVLYFQKKFLQTLNVPISRLNSDSLFSIGRATEITRDELKFDRFVIRLRLRFSQLFTKLLEKQLVLKGILSLEEFQSIASDIKYNFSRDNYFTELKNNEITEGRINLARNIQDMTGKYYSHAWVRKNILQQSDDDIENMDNQINFETNSDDPRWINPTIEQNIQILDQSLQDDNVDTSSNNIDKKDDKETKTKSDPEKDKVQKVKRALSTLEHLKDKRGNRSPQEQEKYMSSSLIVSKNPNIVKKLGNFKKGVDNNGKQ